MKILSVAATIASVGLVLVALTVSYALIVPVDVIDDDTWTIKFEKTQYTVGDKVTLVSSFTKLQDIDGEATRYIVCKSRDNVDVKYKLNEDVAIANKGKGGVGIIVTIPNEIVGVVLPTTCRFFIKVNYIVNALRTHSETTSSAEFTLNPKGGNSSSTSKTTQNTNGSSTTTTTDTNSTTTDVPTTTKSSTPPAPKPSEPTPSEPEPTPVTGIPLIDGVIRGLGL